MINNGLLQEPKFDNPEYYLTSGPRTEVTPKIKQVAMRAEGETDEELAINLLKLMNEVTPYTSKYLEVDPKDFKKSAEEILDEGSRTGSFDSATLYTALLRARGIPAMQIITFNVPAAIKDPQWFRTGYFFVACFLKDKKGNSSWQIIKPHVDNWDIAWNKIGFEPFDLDDRNINNHEYAYAYTRDYSEVNYKGRYINSKQRIFDISRLCFGYSKKQDMTYVKKLFAERKKQEEDIDR